MDITLSVDEKREENARVPAQGMGKIVHQAGRANLEQFAGRLQLESELQFFLDSAQQTPGRLNGWKFDREESQRPAQFPRCRP
jgi:hypothetical protein